MSFKFEETVVPDTEITLFTQTMRFGDRNTQVALLQKKLQSAGFFPSNISCTGYFGAITKKAVIAFQKKYVLVGDGIVGEKTLLKLNEVFK
jgi:peptidoglycan hydrolase-like protein with peptidoglycan-binding domain